MTIRVKKDSIEFVSDEGTIFSLKETGDGFSFNGVIEGTNIFQNGFQGTIAGFSAGGDSPGSVNTIDKFPFAADSNASDVGDLTQVRNRIAGQSSSVSGYSTGGQIPVNQSNTIDKFPFATSSNATDVGDLTQARSFVAGQSSSVSGYTSAGLLTPPGTGTLLNTIDKFPFATDTNATDVGDVTSARNGPAGQSSSTSGYTSGGNPGPGFGNVIDKFPFASDANATDVGDTTTTNREVAGQSSTTHGFTSGGFIGARINTIDKFPFASDTNATDVGDLTQAREVATGQSSTNFGYTSGGYAPPFVNVIDKFPFATNSNATDVGDLSQSRLGAAGQQN